MRKLRVAALAALGILFPVLAHAQSPGPFTRAEILPVDGRAAGVYLNASESLTGLMSQLRLSFYPGIDFGFQGGFSRVEFVGGDRTLLQVGADIRFGVLKASQGAPIDFALGGGFGIDVGDDTNLLSLGPMAFASRTFPAGAGSISPYAVTGISFSTASIGSEDRTDVHVPINLGVEYRPNAVFAVAAELQLRLENRFRDDVGLGAGVTFPF